MIPQLAFVNHLYAVVDRDTVAATERSALLREHANFTVTRVTAEGGESWTGRYLTMRKTYVELFGPNDAGGDSDAPGSIGLALGGDVPGIVDTFVERAKERGLPVQPGLRKRATADGEIDWFEKATLPDGEESPTAVDVWAMEYVASYFDDPGARKRASLGPADEVSRLRYNDGAYRGALFEDLESATFDIDSARFKSRMRPMLDAAGFRVQESAEGAVAESDEATLAFHFASGPYLRALTIRLADPVDDARHETLGRSMLTVGPGRAAHWRFHGA